MAADPSGLMKQCHTSRICLSDTPDKTRIIDVMIYQTAFMGFGPDDMCRKIFKPR